MRSRLDDKLIVSLLHISRKGNKHRTAAAVLRPEGKRPYLCRDLSVAGSKNKKFPRKPLPFPLRQRERRFHRDIPGGNGIRDRHFHGITFAEFNSRGEDRQSFPHRFCFCGGNRKGVNFVRLERGHILFFKLGGISPQSTLPHRRHPHPQGGSPGFKFEPFFGDPEGKAAPFQRHVKEFPCQKLLCKAVITAHFDLDFCPRSIGLHVNGKGPRRTKSFRQQCQRRLAGTSHGIFPVKDLFFIPHPAVVRDVFLIDHSVPAA